MNRVPHEIFCSVYSTLVASYETLGHVRPRLAAIMFQLISQWHKVYNSRLYVWFFITYNFENVKLASRGVL